jgi:hypothetical protein
MHSFNFVIVEFFGDTIRPQEFVLFIHNGSIQLHTKVSNDLLTAISVTVYLCKSTFLQTLLIIFFGWKTSHMETFNNICDLFIIFTL